MGDLDLSTYRPTASPLPSVPPPDAAARRSAGRLLLSHAADVDEACDWLAMLDLTPSDVAIPTGSLS